MKNNIISFRFMNLFAVLALLCMVSCAGGQAKPDENEAAAAKKTITPEMVYDNLFGIPDNVKIPEALKNPATIEDAQNVVRSDNIILFEKADKVFEKHLKATPDDMKNQIWHSQLYLVWGERAQNGARFMAKASGIIERRILKLEEKLKSEKLEPTERENIKDSISLAKMQIDAVKKACDNLNSIAFAKLKKSSEMVLKVLEKNPESYGGYRLAADLYRINKEWEKCHQAMEKIEKLNPESNGLRFIKGAVALHEKKDHKEAVSFLNLAVEKDPKFAKAWFFLASVYMDMKETDKALDALNKCLEVSPGHQLAMAGKRILDAACKMNKQIKASAQP